MVERGDDVGDKFHDEIALGDPLVALGDGLLARFGQRGLIPSPWRRPGFSAIMKRCVRGRPPGKAARVSGRNPRGGCAGEIYFCRKMLRHGNFMPRSVCHFLDLA